MAYGPRGAGPCEIDHLGVSRFGLREPTCPFDGLTILYSSFWWCQPPTKTIIPGVFIVMLSGQNGCFDLDGNRLASDQLESIGDIFHPGSAKFCTKLTTQ